MKKFVWLLFCLAASGFAISNLEEGTTFLRFSWAPPAGGLAGRPIHLPLAVPPGADVVIESVTPLGPENSTGDLSLPWKVTKASKGRYRDVEVVVLKIEAQPGVKNPVHSSGGLRIHLSFAKPGLPSPQIPRRSFAPSRDKPQERALKSWLINYEQSRNFRSLAGTVFPLRRGGAPLSGMRVNFFTEERSIYRVMSSQLENSGLSLSNLDPRYFRLFYQGNEVPMYISGAEDGSWDEGDYLEFVGDRPLGTSLGSGLRSYNSFYTKEAMFTLVWGGSIPGLRAPLTPVAGPRGGVLGDFAADAREAVSHPVRFHIEKDLEIRRIGGTSQTDVQDLGAAVERQAIRDFWFWQRQGPEDILDVEFELPWTPAPGEGPEKKDSLWIRIKLQGITDILTAELDHHLKFLLNSHDISLVGGTENNALWAGDAEFLWKSGLLSANILKAGKNILTIQKVGDLLTTSGDPLSVQDAYLDFIEFDYRASYQAHNNKLNFANDYRGVPEKQRFLIEGLTEQAFSLWDLSGRKLTGFSLTRSGAGSQLTFTDSTFSEVEYELVSESRLSSPRLELDTLPALLSTDNQADYLIITQREIDGPELDRLVSHRESQGLTVKVVYADHIYQLFGGVASDPASLREFVKYAYHHWKRPAPMYLVLVGETSVWFDKQAGGFQQNIVPTNLIQIPGWGVTSNDDYLAKVSGEDDIADLFVGRIPVASRTRLGVWVDKMLAYETERPHGNWQNRYLLLGGFEESFTLTNNRLQGMLVEGSRQFSRRDVYQGSPYYLPAGTGPDFYSQLDSAFNIVAFSGHGGGSVWSDAGLLTLDALDENRLTGTYSVPLMLSMTCLTGFFEDISARSLGEELLRRPASGALAFYGASGYISEVAGTLIAEEIFARTLEAENLPVGELIGLAENSIVLSTGSGFLPILGEFDLLGDPAMPLRFPAREAALSVEGSPREDSPDISIEGRDLGVEAGSSVVSVFARNETSGVDSLYSETRPGVAGGNLSAQYSFSDVENGGLPITQGKVVAHYWDSEKSLISSDGFNSLDWKIESVHSDPDLPMLGADVNLTFQVGKIPGELTSVSGQLTYEIRHKSSPVTNPEASNGGAVGLRLAQNGAVETMRSFPLVLRGEAASETMVEPELRVQINMALEVESGGEAISFPVVRSRVFRLPMRAPVDLQFLAPAVALPIQDDLGAWVYFKNSSHGADTGTLVTLNIRDSANQLIRSVQKSQTTALLPGKTDSLFFSLQESDFNYRLNFQLSPSDSSREINYANNRFDTTFSLRSKMLSNRGDSLVLENYGVLSLEEGEAVRAYIEPFAGSLPIPPHLIPRWTEAGQPLLFKVSAPADYEGTLALRLTDSSQLTPLAKTLGSAAGAGSRPPHAEGAYFHQYIPSISNWLMLDTLESVLPAAAWFQTGVIGVFSNTDKEKPHLAITAKGQKLLPDDYVPQKSSINITIRDNTAIDYVLHPPRITSTGMGFDSTNLINAPTHGLAKTGVLQFDPTGAEESDSLTIVVHDISGNRHRENFTYRKNQGLKVRLYGSYPNPFADSARIVYQLTDWADDIQIKIYSRAGRLVKSLKDTPGTGYREIVWDGRSRNDRDVANGLYYLKLVAKKEGEESSAVFKMFKMKKK